MKTKTFSLALAALGLLTWIPTAVAAGTWVGISQLPDIFDGIDTFVLLSDGSVMAKHDGVSNVWYRLTPDSNGHYVNGQWWTMSPMTYSRLAFATALLPDGRVFVAGGEYGNGSNTVEIYDPVSDSWTIADSATYFGGMADCSTIVLPDGKVLICPQGASSLPAYNGKTFIFNPSDPMNRWHQTAGAPTCGLAEATWVKQPNGRVLSLCSGDWQYGTRFADEYNPATDAWQDATGSGFLPNIWAPLPLSNQVAEIGPALLLPNGSTVFFGGNGMTAVHNNGNWFQGTSIPNGQVTADSPATMMVNGKVLLQVGPELFDNDQNFPVWIEQSSFYEYDYTGNNNTGSFVRIQAPGGGLTLNEVMYNGKMLALPDGTVLWTNGYRGVCIYQPDGSPIAAGKPTVVSVTRNTDGSLHLAGTLFNGISAGACYGDDAQMDTNYPLVRFTDSSGTVRYGRSYNWSSTGVATGSTIVTTECTVPDGASLEDSIQVVANGFASDPVHFPLFYNAETWVDFAYSGSQLGSFSSPYAVMASATAAAPQGSTIRVKAGNLPNAAIRITKPVKISPYGGTAHIGP